MANALGVGNASCEGRIANGQSLPPDESGSRIGAATHLAYVLGHSQEERLDIIQRVGMNELPVVEPETDPEVIHEQREKSHHKGDANGATKLIAKRP